MKRALIVLGVVLGVVVIAGVAMFFKMSRDAEAGFAALKYETVDMSRVADGAYQGVADAGIVYVKVEVSVKDHAMQQIKILEHRNGKGGAAEAITGEMVAANSYDVDAISGATLSSQAIKSAVSTALKQGET
jgi:uncharacterized protein with FMN-binding domain